MSWIHSIERNFRRYADKRYSISLRPAATSLEAAGRMRVNSQWTIASSQILVSVDERKSTKRLGLFYWKKGSSKCTPEKLQQLFMRKKMQHFDSFFLNGKIWQGFFNLIHTWWAKSNSNNRELANKIGNAITQDFVILICYGGFLK